MEKPINLSIKDFIIRKMSVKMGKQESLIETVVNHQFISALGAMEENNSIEFSGFGKLVFNMKKAVKRIEKAESQKAMFMKALSSEELSDVRKRNMETKLENIIKYLEQLKKKVYESSSNNGRVEEHVDSSREIEEGNREGENQ